MNITTLDADTDFLCGSTSATYPLSDKRRNHNIHYHDVARMIWEADGHFDDSNNTDGPVSYKTLGNASASYTIPTTAMRIRGIEVKDSNGNWVKLKPITYEDFTISPEEYLTGVGVPIHYMVEGNEIRLFPSPGSAYVTLTSGMAVRLNRNVTEIPTTATTTEPGFAAGFHRILSLGAAIDFVQDEVQRKNLVGQKARLENALQKFYSKRVQEVKSVVKPAAKKRWRLWT